MRANVSGGRRPPRWVVARFLVGGTVDYAKTLAKNIVKKAIGRAPHFTPDDVLFRHYVRQLCGGPKLDRITCVASTHEGTGSQALMMMTAIDFARANGLTYVHTPFSDIWHADRPMQAWAAAWEAHFNLGEGEVRSDRSGTDAINYAFTFPMLHTLLGVDEADRGFDDETIRDFRRKYYLDKSPRRNEIVSVCVHARRYNSNDFHDEDSTDMAQLARILAQVRSILDARGVDHTLRVFSQGRPEEFRDLGLSTDSLFLDADAIWSMREMIEADILVTTLGTFSHVAGILCDGIVLSHAPVPPASGWIAYDADGNFEAEALARRLPRP